MPQVNPWPYLLLFVVVTFIEGCVALSGGLAWRLTFGLFVASHPLTPMPYWWGRQMKRWCFDAIRFAWNFDDCVDLSGNTSLKIVLFKHPPTLLTWAVGYITGRFVSQRMAFVLKGSHIFNPMGWGLWGLGLAIFATRFHEWTIWRYWPWLQRQLHRLSKWWFRFQVQRIMQRARKLGQGFAIVILPDQRFTEERRHKILRGKLGRAVPDFVNWQGTLLPHYEGVLALFVASAGLNPMVVRVNLTLKAVSAEGWLNFKPFQDGYARVQVYTVTHQVQAVAPGGALHRFDEDPMRLANWLNDFYGAENRFDTAWRARL